MNVKQLCVHCTLIDLKLELLGRRSLHGDGESAIVYIIANDESRVGTIAVWCLILLRDIIKLLGYTPSEPSINEGLRND